MPPNSTWPSCTTCSWPAGTRTWRRAGCARRARATTRSARQAMRATPSWRWPTRPTDPALLHYRSGGFYLARSGLEGISDILSGVVAATSEPISGGRHKVFGRHDLAIIPQTSTIASHLPRGGRRRVRDRSRRQARRCLAVARRRDRGVQLRRCLGQPQRGHRRVQQRGLLRIPAPAHAAAVRL